jgi:malic enzyme
VSNLRDTSATVAATVARAAVQDGVAQTEVADPAGAVHDAMWQAAYPPLDLEH